MTEEKKEKKKGDHLFKKGNKLAVGAGGGRKPVEFSDEEAIEIGKELLEWMHNLIDEGKPPVHFVQFYLLKKGLFLRQWDALCDRKVFAPYYECARELMVLATQSNKELNTAYGSRFIGLYSRDLRAHEKEIAAEKGKNLVQEQKNLVDIIVAASKGDLKQEDESKSN